MVSRAHKDCKECVDLLDNQVLRDHREGQVAKDPKDLLVRKVQGEKKDLVGSPDPRENQDFRENQGKMD